MWQQVIRMAFGSFVVVAIWAHSSHAQTTSLKAGAFAMDITPLKFPVEMNGNMQAILAARAHDPLHARCIVLDDGQIRIAIAVVDSCMIPRELFDSAKRQASELTGIPTDRMLMSATHSHSCPAVTGVFQSEAIPEYATFLAERIAAGVHQASQNLAPAKVAWGVGRDETQIFNRRWWLKEPNSETNPFGLIDKVRMNPGFNNPKVTKPAGPTDPEVRFLSLKTPDNRPLAFLANYSLHYVGGTGGGELSADYFGAFSDRITQLLNASADDKSQRPSFVGIMSNGTSGDVNNANYSLTTVPKYQPYERLKAVADSVATTAATAHAKVEYHSSTTMAMRETEIELKVRKPSPEEITRAKELLATAGSFPYKTMPQVYARESLKMAEYPDTVKLKLQAIRIGEQAIVAIPCEVFTEVGLEIKRRSPLPNTFTIELANGYNGYLPTVEQHDNAGYETWRARSSYLETTAAPKILEAVLRLLNEVK